ncbi:transcriptional repressor LexA [Patescibacteria group bacterium]|nr:transcriptional repressor LexA [Patescibacteria group bacterium]
MENLTKKQTEILNYLVEYINNHSYPPSIREIGANFGLTSPATIHAHLRHLQQKGYLSSTSSARSIRLSAKVFRKGAAVQLPLAGLIAAGEPIEAIEDKEMITVPADLVRDHNSFVLQVKGESMIEEGILDGDYVIVEQNYYPQNGDVVVALLDNTYATLKKYFREKSRIRLQPANKSMKPIFAKNPAIQGIVRGIFRKFNPA